MQPSLDETLAEIRSRIARSTSRRLKEQDTKATLIEPVLRALGWNTGDPDEVTREYRLRSVDKPVDYALLNVRTARLLLEAKALGENLDDPRWANQIMGYASVAGVQWIVLTDGNEYQIYNAHAPVSVEEKLFRKVRVSELDPLVAETLGLLAKDRLEENRIEVLWRAHFVDRQVEVALDGLFSGDADPLIVDYVAQHTKNLTTDEVRSSLARCRIETDFPVLTEALLQKTPAREPTRAGAAQVDVSVQDLIEAGMLQPPVQIERRYKGKLVTARIDPDGRITCLGVTYDSLSAAGGAARASVNGAPDGRHPPTNGWTFWRMKDRTGVQIDLDLLRQQRLAKVNSPKA